MIIFTESLFRIKIIHKIIGDFFLEGRGRILNFFLLFSCLLLLVAMTENLKF